jgi:hypothetical protein
LSLELLEQLFHRQRARVEPQRLRTLRQLRDLRQFDETPGGSP